MSDVSHEGPACVKVARQVGHADERLPLRRRGDAFLRERPHLFDIPEVNLVEVLAGVAQGFKENSSDPPPDLCLRRCGAREGRFATPVRLPHLLDHGGGQFTSVRGVDRRHLSLVPEPKCPVGMGNFARILALEHASGKCGPEDVGTGSIETRRTERSPNSLPDLQGANESPLRGLGPQQARFRRQVFTSLEPRFEVVFEEVRSLGPEPSEVLVSRLAELGANDDYRRRPREADTRVTYTELRKVTDTEPVLPQVIPEYLWTNTGLAHQRDSHPLSRSGDIHDPPNLFRREGGFLSHPVGPADLQPRRRCHVVEPEPRLGYRYGVGNVGTGGSPSLLRRDEVKEQVSEEALLESGQLLWCGPRLGAEGTESSEPHIPGCARPSGKVVKPTPNVGIAQKVLSVELQVSRLRQRLEDLSTINVFAPYTAWTPPCPLNGRSRPTLGPLVVCSTSWGSYSRGTHVPGVAGRRQPPVAPRASVRHAGHFAVLARAGLRTRALLRPGCAGWPTAGTRTAPGGVAAREAGTGIFGSGDLPHARPCRRRS